MPASGTSPRLSLSHSVAIGTKPTSSSPWALEAHFSAASSTTLKADFSLWNVQDAEAAARGIRAVDRLQGSLQVYFALFATPADDVTPPPDPEDSQPQVASSASQDAMWHAVSTNAILLARTVLSHTPTAVGMMVCGCSLLERPANDCRPVGLVASSIFTMSRVRLHGHYRFAACVLLSDPAAPPNRRPSSVSLSPVSHSLPQAGGSRVDVLVGEWTPELVVARERAAARKLNETLRASEQHAVAKYIEQLRHVNSNDLLFSGSECNGSEYEKQQPPNSQDEEAWTRGSDFGGTSRPCALAGWSPLLRSAHMTIDVSQPQHLYMLAQHYHKYLIGVCQRKICPYRASKLVVPLSIPDGMYSLQCSNFIMFVADSHRINDVFRQKRLGLLSSQFDNGSGSARTDARPAPMRGVRATCFFKPFDGLSPQRVVDALIELCGCPDASPFWRSKGPWTIEWFDYLLLATVEAPLWGTLMSLAQKFRQFKKVVSSDTFRQDAAHQQFQDSETLSDVESSDSDAYDMRAHLFFTALALEPKESDRRDEWRERLKAFLKDGGPDASRWKRLCEDPEHITPARAIWSLFPVDLQDLALRFVNSDLPVLVTRKKAQQNARLTAIALQLQDDSSAVLIRKYFLKLRLHARERHEFKRRRQIIRLALERRMNSSAYLRFYTKWVRWLVQRRIVNQQRMAFGVMQSNARNYVLVRFYDKWRRFPGEMRAEQLWTKNSRILLSAFVRRWALFLRRVKQRRTADALWQQCQAALLSAAFQSLCTFVFQRRRARKVAAAEALLLKTRRRILRSFYFRLLNRVLPRAKKRRRAMTYRSVVFRVAHTSRDIHCRMRFRLWRTFTSQVLRERRILQGLAAIATVARGQHLQKAFSKWRKFAPQAATFRRKRKERQVQAQQLAERNVSIFRKRFFSFKWARWYNSKFVERHRRQVLCAIVVNSVEQRRRFYFILWRKCARRRVAIRAKAEPLRLLARSSEQQLAVRAMSRWMKKSPSYIKRRAKRERNAAMLEKCLRQASPRFLMRYAFVQLRSFAVVHKRHVFRRTVTETLRIANELMHSRRVFLFWRRWVVDLRRSRAVRGAEYRADTTQMEKRFRESWLKDVLFVRFASRIQAKKHQKQLSKEARTVNP